MNKEEKKKKTDKLATERKRLIRCLASFELNRPTYINEHWEYVFLLNCNVYMYAAL